MQNKIEEVKVKITKCKQESEELTQYLNKYKEISERDMYGAMLLIIILALFLVVLVAIRTGSTL